MWRLRLGPLNNGDAASRGPVTCPRSHDGPMAKQGGHLGVPPRGISRREETLSGRGHLWPEVRGGLGGAAGPSAWPTLALCQEYLLLGSGQKTVSEQFRFPPGPWVSKEGLSGLSTQTQAPVGTSAVPVHLPLAWMWQYRTPGRVLRAWHAGLELRTKWD